MNAADQNEETPESVIQGPGKQLRDIRVSKELDIHRVAGLLHLNVSMLEALEADDFSKLPSAVFVQGYLRNYARLLDIPVAPILDAFQQYRPVGEESMSLKAAQVRHEVRSSHTVVRLITWLIVIGIIALVVTWWRGYLQWPLDLSLESGSLVEEQQAETASPGEARPPIADGAITLPSLLDKPEIIDAPVSEPAEAVGTGALDSNVSETTPEAVVPQEEEPRAPAAEETAPEASSPPAVEAVAGESGPLQSVSGIQVSFSDNCWTDITDASGSFRVLGNKVAGDRLVLEGEAPYKMVFGNASAVTIRVNGADYDLAPHIRGNVAKFTLQPE